MVGHSEAPQYSYDWTFRGIPVFVWLDSQRPPGFRLDRLLEASRFSYGCTLRGQLVLCGCTLRGLWFSYEWTLSGYPVFVRLEP